MDRITRCPQCGKRLVPVVMISGRPAVKLAESLAIAPEKPIVAEPV
jgi:hypothetical protein